MSGRRNGVSFVVSLTERVSIDEVAKEVSAALGAQLRESDERGLRDDFFGEIAGMRLWLRIVDPASAEKEHRIGLMGDPVDRLDDDASWVDIGCYVAELLTARTGRAWQNGAS